MLLSTLMALSAENTSEVIARAAVHDLVEGRYAEIVAASTPEMAKALPADKLATVWAGVLAQVGPLHDLGAPTTVDVKDGALVTIPLHFAKATLDCKITVVADKIAGLFLAPPETPPPAWSAPSYSKRAAFSEADITVGSPSWALPGTLLLPVGGGRAPAVVLVHGSGPGDRNETVGANRPFQDLAEGLASRGIAVLRYDKRTKVYTPSGSRLIGSSRRDHHRPLAGHNFTEIRARHALADGLAPDAPLGYGTRREGG